MANNNRSNRSKCLSFFIYDSREEYSYDDYVSWCEDNDYEPEPEYSSDYYDWCSQENSFAWDCLFDNLRYSKQNEIPCVIDGTLGLWHGRPTIEPVFMDSLAAAIRKCLGSCDDIKVEMENGVVNVQAYHHDGTNCFTIRPLSKKGQALNLDNISEVKEYMLAKYHGYLF